MRNGRTNGGFRRGSVSAAASSNFDSVGNGNNNRRKSIDMEEEAPDVEALPKKE